MNTKHLSPQFLSKIAKGHLGYGAFLLPIRSSLLAKGSARLASTVPRIVQNMGWMCSEVTVPLSVCKAILEYGTT